MNKQRYISSFLLCVFAFMFAHSIVPHHHHEKDISTFQSNYHDDDNDDFDGNFLQKAFSNVQHVSNSSNTCQATTSTSSQYSKFVVDEDAILLGQYFFKQFFKPPIIHQAQNKITFTSTILLASNLFRGPPCA